MKLKVCNVTCDRTPLPFKQSFILLILSAYSIRSSNAIVKRNLVIMLTSFTITQILAYFVVSSKKSDPFGG